jgi:hypothetical protein
MTGDIEGDWKRAEDNARAKLIEQIRVQVGQTVTSQEVEEITGKKSLPRRLQRSSLKPFQPLHWKAYR